MRPELCGLGSWSLVKVVSDGNGEGWSVEESLTTSRVALRFS